MENIVPVNYTRYAHWFSVIILKCVINNSFFRCLPLPLIFHAPASAVHSITLSHFCADSHLFILLWVADSVATFRPRADQDTILYFFLFFSFNLLNKLSAKAFNLSTWRERFAQKKRIATHWSSKLKRRFSRLKSSAGYCWTLAFSGNHRRRWQMRYTYLYLYLYLHIFVWAGHGSSLAGLGEVR